MLSPTCIPKCCALSGTLGCVCVCDARDYYGCLSIVREEAIIKRFWEGIRMYTINKLLSWWYYTDAIWIYYTLLLRSNYYITRAYKNLLPRMVRHMKRRNCNTRTKSQRTNDRTNGEKKNEKSPFLLLPVSLLPAATIPIIASLITVRASMYSVYAVWCVWDEIIEFYIYITSHHNIHRCALCPAMNMNWNLYGSMWTQCHRMMCTQENKSKKKNTKLYDTTICHPVYTPFIDCNECEANNYTKRKKDVYITQRKEIQKVV